MNRSGDADRDALLNEAAVLLLVGAGDPADCLRGVRDRLRALPSDPEPPAWERDTLARALATIEQALDGALPAADAQERVATLLEQVLSGVEPAPRPSIATAARELIPEFIAEATDCLAQAESALLELDADGRAEEPVNTVFRAFHSIKSSAAFLGLDALSALAHDAESLLALLRDRDAALDTGHVDLLLAAADGMRELLAGVHVEADAPPALPPRYGELRQRLHDAVTATARPALVTADSVSPAVEPAVEAAPEPAGESGARPRLEVSSGGEAWARVRTLRLDQLIDLVGELAVAHSMVAQDPAVVGDRHGNLARKVQRTSKIVRELHDLSIWLRMVTMRPLFQRLHRLVRDVARQSGKRVELVTEGEETEIDRSMVEVLTDPLIHMIRNAIDHAIEPAAERAARGKPEDGTLRLTAQHSGGAIVIELRDDGRGLDRERIRRRAIERGVITADQQLGDAEVDALIFAPGLSTSSAVTELSGRGVGMDVVRRNIESLRGRIEIASIPGEGTTFTLRLPLTLAVTDGMLVRVGGERYIVPTFAIETTFRPTPAALVTEAQGGELVLLQGESLPLVRLHHVFGVAGANANPAKALLVVIAEGASRFALLVDELLGQHQFVAKPMTDAVDSVAGVAGTAVLGDGCVGLILDPSGLLAAARQLPVWGRTPPASSPRP